MPAHPSRNPWPAQTPHPATPRSLLHDRDDAEPPPNDITDFDQIQQAEQACQFDSGNDVFSCFPTVDTVVPQHMYAGIVWNSRVPQFTPLKLVDIYLFHAENASQIFVLPNVTNPVGNAGFKSFQVNDTWFGAAGASWNGQNISRPYFFVVQAANKPLDGTESTLAVFNAVQTTFADSVVASMASTASVASASSASASSASASSASAASLSSVEAASSSSRAAASQTQNPANVQSGASSSAFPHWAIAVIVILGFLAIASTCVLFFCILARIRRRNRIKRNSMGSDSPMMANVGHSAGSPLLATGPDRHSSVGHRAPSIVSPDGASTISRVGSVGDSGPFSGADAAIMADAFRKALRKPDFVDRPVEEGESPETPDVANPQDDALLNQHLAEEGRDIRSVSSSRGVKVETLSDSGETAQDSH